MNHFTSCTDYKTISTTTTLAKEEITKNYLSYYNNSYEMNKLSRSFFFI